MSNDMKKKNLSVFEKHQERIAKDTLKMNDVGASIMGGMTKAEARQFLLSIGYTQDRIDTIEGVTTRSKAMLPIGCLTNDGKIVSRP